ncbi:MAG: hypothetical protein ACM3S1_01940 [Hyphomicrobiales bacterium]
MFPNQFSDLEVLAHANHGRFVHPGKEEPEWVRRKAAEQQALAELKADWKAAEARELGRPGFFRRLVMAVNGA